jgi:thioredoxin 2
MIRACPHCARKNRVPASRLADRGRCGSCKHAIAAVAEPLNVDAEQFREIIGSSTVPVLVDFWAEWCGPCRLTAPSVQKTAENVAGKALVLKVNTEKFPELASAFNVRGIPNFAVFKDGRLVLQQAGLVDQRQMQQWLEQAA